MDQSVLCGRSIFPINQIWRTQSFVVCFLPPKFEIFLHGFFCFFFFLPFSFCLFFVNYYRAFDVVFVNRPVRHELAAFPKVSVFLFELFKFLQNFFLFRFSISAVPCFRYSNYFLVFRQRRQRQRYLVNVNVNVIPSASTSTSSCLFGKFLVFNKMFFI